MMVAWQVVYAASLAFRLVLLFTQSAYIHPDEHFQCAQVAARTHLDGYEGLELPWEYAPGRIARSYLPVEILCGIPFAIWHWLPFTKDGDMKGALVLLKLWMFGLSVLSDALSVTISNQFQADWKWILIVRSTSWANLIFGTKTFSNVLESIYLEAVTVVLFSRTHPRGRAFLAGLLIGCGSFVRITFPAFAAVIGLEALRQELVSVNKKSDGDWYAITIGAFRFSLAVAVGACLAISALIAADSALNGGFVIGPLVNIMYNMNTANLAKHGLHPMWTHAIINLQILFGPLGLLGLRKVATAKLKTSEKILVAAILLPLVTLSFFPHQEFRFLYPLVTPLTILTASYLRSRWLFSVWIVFNLVIGTVFGIAHQAGVTNGVTRAADICRERKLDRCCLAGRNVYMLPTYPLGDQLPRFRVENFPDYAIPASFLESCDLVLALGPNSVFQRDGIAGKTMWRHPGLHFNGEAGGFVDLTLMEVAYS